jgi:hypothetical protein
MISDWMSMNKLGKKMVMAYIKILLWQWFGGTEDNHLIFQLGQLISGIIQMSIRWANHYATMSE